MKAFINKQVYRCITNDDYLFGIYVSNKTDSNYIETILAPIVHNFYLYRYIKSASGIIIEFKNGSRIDIIARKLNCRGKKYHALAINNKIDYETKYSTYFTFVNYPLLAPEEEALNNYGLDILEFKIDD